MTNVTQQTPLQIGDRVQMANKESTMRVAGVRGTITDITSTAYVVAWDDFEDAAWEHSTEDLEVVK